jgi:hypothetical protein
MKKITEDPKFHFQPNNRGDILSKAMKNRNGGGEKETLELCPRRRGKFQSSNGCSAQIVAVLAAALGGLWRAMPVGREAPSGPLAQFAPVARQPAAEWFRAWGPGLMQKKGCDCGGCK